MTRRAGTVALIALAVMTASALYLRVLTRRDTFRPPPIEEEEAVRTRLTEAALESKTGPTGTAKLYFPAHDQRALRAETRQINWAETDTDRIRQVLLALIEGSRQGYGRVLPPAAGLRAVFLTPDGTAFIDLAAQPLKEFTPGISGEFLALNAIVNSLTANVPAVKQVRFLVEGQEADTLEGHADLTNAYVPDLASIMTGP